MVLHGVAPAKPSGGRHPAPPKVEYIRLMPEWEAERLAATLDSERLARWNGSPATASTSGSAPSNKAQYVSDPVKRDLKFLAHKLREAGKFAEHPATSYATFSTKVKGYSHDFKEHLKRLTEALKEKES